MLRQTLALAEFVDYARGQFRFAATLHRTLDALEGV
jgi:hypothetical protein